MVISRMKTECLKMTLKIRTLSDDDTARMKTKCLIMTLRMKTELDINTEDEGGVSDNNTEDEDTVS